MDENKCLFLYFSSKLSQNFECAYFGVKFGIVQLNMFCVSPFQCIQTIFGAYYSTIINDIHRFQLVNLAQKKIRNKSMMRGTIGARNRRHRVNSMSEHMFFCTSHFNIQKFNKSRQIKNGVEC